MPVEVLGMIGAMREASGGAAVSIIGGGVDGDYIAEFARAHEAAGFDQVLVGYGSVSADGMAVAAHAISQTTRLHYLIAHRPGVVTPTLAARKFATLDRLSGGRVSMHVITGGSDVDLQRDGDWLDHDTRYRRTDEYLAVVHRTWTSTEPFDFEGEFYRLRGAFSDVRCVQQPHVPVYFGGSSAAALAVGAKHADVYMLWGEPLSGIRQQMDEVRAAAGAHGREPSFSVSFRPIIADNEEAAWERARRILAGVTAARPADAPARPRPQAVGSQRLLEFAAQGELHDRRLWMPVAAATGAAGNTSALVGTPAQVVEALLDYYDLGVRAFLLRGFDPLADAHDYGRELIPRLHEAVLSRDRHPVSV